MMQEIFCGEDYGFTVMRYDRPNHKGWSVYLPHQCSSWTIGKDEYGYPDLAPRAETADNLRRFIAEAIQALRALDAADDV